MTGHLAACTGLALIALAATLGLRGERAAWRHAILFLALLRFAIPTAWLTYAGHELVRVAPARPPMRRAAEDLAWLLRSPGVDARTPALPGSPRPFPYRGALWASGTALCLGFWSRRVWRKIPAVRAATGAEAAAFQRAAGAVPVRLRIVAPDLVPGAWGWWRPHVILPDGLSAVLSEAELEAVMAHEVAHVRRHDNVSAAIAHAVASVFWFHPLVWWLERRMLAERETACDELVLARGSRAEDYVGAILKVCRMSFAGAAGYAGVNGSNLKDRMEYIMSVDLNRRSSRAARALLAVFFALIATLPVAGGYLAAQPAQGSARYQEGVSLLNEKKYAEADQAFHDAYLLNPSNSRALMGQVEVRMSSGRTDDALRLLQDELEKDPSRADLRLALGNTAVRGGKYDQALAEFQQVLSAMDKDSPAMGDLYRRIGETYRRKGDFESAIANLRRAQQAIPGDVVTASTLALVLDAAGKTAEAERQYRAVLELDPNNGVALNNLAYLLSESGGDLDEALALAEHARDLLPNLDEVSDTLGWIYLKKNFADKAIAVFDGLVSRKPSNATYRYHLGMGLAQKGDSFAAAEQLRKALTSNPSEETAQRIQRLLTALGK